MSESKRGLVERLDEDAVICAEGYLFELERRGYLQAGAFVPEVVLEFPEAVKQLHREFVRAGSDVIEALTYYAHREKLRIVDKEHLLEPLQKGALELAFEVAAEFKDNPPLVAGNICNTNVWSPDGSSDAEVRRMFDEQIAWAVEANVDFLIAETFSYCGEAEIAMAAVHETGLPAVITFALHEDPDLRDGVAIEEAAQRIEQMGANVVGLNCTRGPDTMLPVGERVRKAVSCHVAMLPVPYRTRGDRESFQSLTDSACDCIPDDRPFPTALDPFVCNRFEMAEFARKAKELDIRYLGVCCGGAPHHVRAMVEALGRRPPASRYSPDLSKHYSLGSDERLKEYNVGYVDGLMKE